METDRCRKPVRAALAACSIPVRLTLDAAEGIQSLQLTTGVNRSALIRLVISAGLPLILKQLDIHALKAKAGGGTAPEPAN
ncbi:MAG: hypothetical protein JWM59_2939 [Verrucomicrobiales bacterium]|nr:hypothetical protein [Verrucomicrobiales bacterium]